VRLTTHSGTHLDAPWHFHPTMDGGRARMTIDEVPLEWCFQRGVKLDFRAFPDGYVVTAQDVEDELKASICNRSTSCWSTRRRAWRWAARLSSTRAAAWAMRRPCT
jgi:kynurenine formamidase